MAIRLASLKLILLGLMTAACLSACQGDGSGSGIDSGSGIGTGTETDTDTDTDTDTGTDDDDDSLATIKIGNGGGDSFRDGTATAALVSASINNSDWNVSVVVVGSDNIAVTTVYSVSFYSPCVSSGLSTFGSSPVSTVAGRAATTYSSGTCNGVDTVVASIVVAGQTLSAQVDLDIDTAVASAGGGTDVSALSMGSGSGTAFIAGTLAASSTSLQAGASASISANIVDIDNAPYVTPVSVSFSSGCVSTGLASFSQSSPLSSGGLATTVYTAEGCSGNDIVSASVTTVDGQDLSANVTLAIATDTVLGVEFVSNSESTLAIAGIGGDETALVTFRIVGAQGAPIVGEEVSFELSNSAGGSTLAAGTETGETNNSGEVSAVVQSGTVNSSLHVIATHDATGIQGFSDDISISTGVPINRSFDISLSSVNPHAWNVNGTEVTVTANVSDQFGNAPPNGTRVSFRSPEIGIIDASCELIDGECFAIWRSSGDRSRITAEADDGVGYNNRAGRATIIGFMSGAEDFDDLNANGLFDADSAGEAASVVDLAEAYTDENEDGVFNTTEDFVDSFLNNPVPTDSISGGVNGSYDASGDGIYNGPCSELINSDCPRPELQSTTVWDQAVISLSSDQVQFCDMGTLPALGTIIDATFPVSGVILCDINSNSLPAGTVISFTHTHIELIGVSSYTVPSNTTEPAGPFSVTIIPEGSEQASASFSITVAVPGGAQTQYTWLVNEYP